MHPILKTKPTTVAFNGVCMLFYKREPFRLWGGGEDKHTRIHVKFIPMTEAFRLAHVSKWILLVVVVAHFTVTL